MRICQVGIDNLLEIEARYKLPTHFIRAEVERHFITRLAEILPYPLSDKLAQLCDVAFLPNQVIWR